MKDGQINYINFGGSKGREINTIHLAVLFTIPNINDLVFCIPLTSPKIKHFKSEEDFINRNYMNTKHFNLQYLKQTDSIALLLDQMKIISTIRILKPFKNQYKEQLILNAETLKILKLKISKYLNAILNKKTN